MACLFLDIVSVCALPYKSVQYDIKRNIKIITHPPAPLSKKAFNQKLNILLDWPKF